MAIPAPSTEFESKEEFRMLCHTLAGRLHYLNRVAIGESNFVWQLADLLDRAGVVFDEHLKNDETRAAFGTGYEAGTLPKADRSQALFDLLYASE